MIFRKITDAFAPAMTQRGSEGALISGNHCSINYFVEVKTESIEFVAIIYYIFYYIEIYSQEIYKPETAYCMHDI